MPTLRDFIKNPKKTFDKYSSISLLITNLSYFIFFSFDNIAILTKFKLLNFLKYRQSKYTAYYSLSVGLVAAMAYYLVLLRKSYKKEYELKTYLSSLTPAEFCQHLGIHI